MKDTFVTLYDSKMDSVGSLCEQSLSRFTSPIVFRELPDKLLHPSWNKLLAVLEVMESLQDGDWIAWIDADCILNKRLEMSKISNISSAKLIFPSGIITGLCACAFGIKVCDWSKRFLDAVLFAGDVADNDKYWKGAGPKWEENAIKALFNEFPSIRNNILLTGNTWCITASPWIRDRALEIPVHHFGAIDNNERLRRMSQALNRKYE